MNKAKISFIFLLFVLAISACGGTETATKVGEVGEAEMSEAPEGESDAKPSATPQAEPEATQEAEPEATQEAEPEATQEAEPEATQEAEPEATQEAEPEATQEALPTEVAELVIEPEDFQRGYGTLLIFDMSTLMVEETAKQLADDEIDGMEGLGRLLVVGAMFKAVDESLSAGAPNEAFEVSWQKAGEILPVVGDVVRRWGDKEIKSDEVLEELVGPREQIDEMMGSLDEKLVSEYGGDAAALAQFREETAAEFQANLQGPTASEQGQEAEEVAATDAATAQGPTMYEMGDIINIGDLVVVVLGWDAVPSSESHQPDESKEFMAVDVLILNQGSESVNISADLQMYVKDSSDQRYGPDFSAQLAVGNEDPSGELSPSERVRGQVGFQVPTDVVGDLAFVFDVSLFGAGQLLVELGAEPVTIDAPEELPGEQVPERVAVGESYEIGDIAIVLLGWDIVPSTDFHEADEGYEFIAVDVLILNQGQEPENLSADLQMVVKDGTGQRYGPDFKAQLATSSEDPSGELSPAERVRGTVGFQVPSDVVGDLDLVFDASVWGKGQGFFELGAEPVAVEAPESFGGGLAPERFAVGDMVEIGDVVMIVLGWQIVPSTDFHEPDEGHEFMAVDLLMINGGSNPLNLSADLQMVVKDSSGQRYSPDFGAQEAIGSQTPNGELSPTERVRGQVAFQVPADVVGDLTFVFDAEVWGTGQLFVELGAEAVALELPEELPGEQAPEGGAIGDVTQIADLVMVVLGWDVVAGTDFHQPTEGHEFMTVDALILNQGSEAQNLSADLQMVVKDSTGQRYSPNFAAQQAVDNEGLNGELNPNERIRGQVAFEVPTNVVGDLVFVFDGGIWEQGKVFVELGAEPIAVELPESLSSE